jgi:hypothetical protein
MVLVPRHDPNLRDSVCVRVNGDEPTSGWARNPQIEAEIATWYNITRLDEEKTIVHWLNRLAFDQSSTPCYGSSVTVAFCLAQDCHGIVQAPAPVFWGVSKAV